MTTHLLLCAFPLLVCACHTLPPLKDGADSSPVQSGDTGDCPGGAAPGSWYTDADGDGFGDPDGQTTACEQPDGTSGDGDDCDDTDATISPAATEACDAADNDCDGAIDEAGATGESTWYADADDDAYGEDSVRREACATTSRSLRAAREIREVGAAREAPQGGLWGAAYAPQKKRSAGHLCGGPSVAGWGPRHEPPDGYVAVGGDCDDADPEKNLTCVDLRTGDVSLVADTLDDGAVRFGGEISGEQAGDVDGDFATDLLVGAPAGSTTDSSYPPGDAYVICGVESADALTGDASVAYYADASFEGDDNGDQTGYAVSFVGDTNLDGCDDLLIGAPHVDGGTYATSNAGHAWLVSGCVEP